ncbi:hypothetical protein [Porphyromonas catoniae]|uniref:hypothetical protein n=1 Tax=Porphyromonas catoniae TaxID=41976 RepID=UPI0028D612B7|nr:hypothetical protein [Porphyromonas catoniae]
MDKQTKLPTPEESRQHYSVPEGYFDALEERILARLPEIPQEDTPEQTRPSLWIRVRPIVYLAAVFVSMNLIFRAFFSPAHKEGTQRVATTTTEVQDEDYTTYYAEYGGQVAAYDADKSLFLGEAGFASTSYSSYY